ncbi:RNA polymerase sigma factor for flagellar operon FliA [Enterococcus sp. DIV2402]|uniref:RNA polymerase sigma factor for flagellar operon FliA n=1 Tax=Candidatus Enterococcus lowellii TaxID=2230877 RepID=A0ABZ2SQ41_9ENTE|nr:FliA/WhiG family RNA polymerase sigma factor [Enterococcus sp. DIV2402]MBO0465742.1 FliA/WhiG family RNA polymerase sigma factor [Enterococcus sp. DIV2402]
MYAVNMEDEIIKYLPLVERVVNRIGIKSQEYEKGDLFNIGVIGLMDALHKFDASKKVPFESYAAIRIRGAIIDEVRKNAKLSRYKMARVNAYYQVKQSLEQELKREVTDNEICKELEIDSKQLGEIFDSIHYLASMSLEDTLFNQEDEGIELKDTIKDTSIISAEEQMLEVEHKQALQVGIQKLTEREQLLLSLYYKEELTLREIAEVLDVSIARVSQIHGKTISKLKQIIQEEMS